MSVRETENLVRKALKGESTAARKSPELSAVSVVLRASGVRVELQQKASGAARIVVEVADAKMRDELIEALRSVVDG